MPITETERMIIRELSEDDLATLHEILSDPEVMRFSIRGVCDEAATKGFLSWCRFCYRSGGLGPWALESRSDGTLIGFCGVAPEKVAGRERLNLGYRLARPFWGKGLATEAAGAVLRYAFEEGGAAEVIALIEPEHKASQRVIQKLGCTEYEYLMFQQRGVRCYRLTRDVHGSAVCCRHLRG